MVVEAAVFVDHQDGRLQRPCALLRDIGLVAGRAVELHFAGRQPRIVRRDDRGSGGAGGYGSDQAGCGRRAAGDKGHAGKEIAPVHALVRKAVVKLDCPLQLFRIH
jgi:hypothetical protein